MLSPAPTETTFHGYRANHTVRQCLSGAKVVVKLVASRGDRTPSRPPPPSPHRPEGPAAQHPRGHLLIARTRNTHKKLPMAGRVAFAIDDVSCSTTLTAQTLTFF